MTFYYPFPLLGMVVWEYGAAEICVHVTGNVWKRYDCWWLLMIVEQWFRNLYTTGASSLHVFLHYFYRTDLTTSTVPAAHEPVTTFTLTTFNRRPSQPRTSSWRQSLVIPPRSHVSVIRQLSWAGHHLASSFRCAGRARTATCAFYAKCPWNTFSVTVSL